MEGYYGASGPRFAQAPTEPEPGGRGPAPVGLRLVQEFLNTNDIEARSDAFADVGRLRRWLRSHALLAGPEDVSEDDRQLAITVREALRTLVIARDDGDEGGDVREATEALERASRAFGLTLRLEPDRWDLVGSGSGIEQLLGRVLGDVTKAMADGSWSRLKACRRDACRWVFWDASRNRTGTWCAMSICGNRVKGASFRARRRAPSARATRP